MTQGEDELACCSKCPMPAIIYQRYSGMHLCQAHFEDDIHRKARETLRQSGLFAHGLRLALLMDGGEGSAVMASIIKSLFGCRRDIDLIALIVDDRGPGLRAARIACQQLGLCSSIEILPALPRNGEERGDLLPDPSRPAQRVRRAADLAQERGADAMATGEDLEGYDSHHPAPAAHTRQGGQALCPPAWPLLLPGEGEERGDRRGEEKEREDGRDEDGSGGNGRDENGRRRDKPGHGKSYLSLICATRGQSIPCCAAWRSWA